MIMIMTVIKMIMMTVMIRIMTVIIMIMMLVMIMIMMLTMKLRRAPLQRSLSTGGCSITKYSSSHSFNPLMSSKSELNLSAKKVVSRLCVSCFKIDFLVE